MLADTDEAVPAGDRTPPAKPRGREGRGTTGTPEVTAPRLSRKQSKGLEAAVRHLRDGPADRDAAMDAITAAGFSRRKAEEIVAAIVAELIAAARRARQTRKS